MSKNDISLVLDLAAQGWSLTDIAEETGKSKAAVRQILARRSLNVTRDAQRKRNFQAEIASMKPMDAVYHLLEALDVLCAMEIEPLDKWAEVMTRSEAVIMSTLERNAPNAVTKSALYDRLYGLRADCDLPATKILDVLVCKVRKKLPEGYQIETVWGKGYRLKTPPAACLDDTSSSD